MLWQKELPSADLVIRGARVLDPAEGIDARLEVRIDGGTIAEVAEQVDANGHRVVDATGSFCDADLVADMQKFWGGKKLPGLERRLAQATQDATQCVQLKTRERGNLGSWLRR